MTWREELQAVDGSPKACRRFGLWVGGALLCLGAWGLLRSDGPWIRGALVVGAVLVTLGIVRPTALHKVHLGWMTLAILLGRVVSPLVLGLLYFGVFTPIGWLARLSGKDFLGSRRDPQAATYWNRRSPESPPCKAPRYLRQG
jgi:hypothetical protein